MEKDSIEGIEKEEEDERDIEFGSEPESKSIGRIGFGKD